MNLSAGAKSIMQQEPILAAITAILVTEIYRSNQSNSFSPRELVWTVLFPRPGHQNSPNSEPSCQEQDETRLHPLAWSTQIVVVLIRTRRGTIIHSCLNSYKSGPASYHQSHPHYGSKKKR
ncbi:hypothetical protein OIU79_004661 [Salix purpurea]|uniref:Uncharacterized protein n=1 Tax=Salix purpurea TaxID=77065 RepID=A0A9Q0UAV0_SALPP|nr:hypothetical protein OIU79_004661 [Salix purpurea]